MNTFLIGLQNQAMMIEYINIDAPSIDHAISMAFKKHSAFSVVDWNYVAPFKLRGHAYEGLASFDVSLYEDSLLKVPNTFRCWASDKAHAAEQEMDAYPEGTLMGIEFTAPAWVEE